MLELKDFEAAADRMKNVIHNIPLSTSCTFSAMTGAEVYLKYENQQKTGSFKVRGAYNKIMKRFAEGDLHAVVASSAGNHAQGVAFAATAAGVKSTIVMPRSAPIAKVSATQGYGAEVVLAGNIYDEAYAKACEICEETGAEFIHPFDDEDVMAGQGTIALEILRDLPGVDMIFVPAGGGGLISGVAFAIKQLNPNIKVYGVQASGAPSMYESIHNDKITCLDSVSTIADGIAVKEPGPHTFEYVKKYVDDIVTVTDDEISAAILALIEKQKLIAEGAGAASVAAAMFHKVPVEGKKVVCLVSGGNIDVTILSRVIKRGLLMSGRSCMLNIELLDKPGQLKDVSRIIADLGGNVISIHHERANEGSDINGCFLRITMETRDYAHIQEIRSALMDAGFHLVD